MLVFSPLRRRPIACLWAGQVLSAIGDEIYKVALIWLAIDLVGAKAGFLGAVQAASLLVFGTLGGAWADRWDHRRTMIGVDTLRCLVVLVPPLVVCFAPLSLWILLPVAILVSSLSAFFDPALQAAVPELTDSPDLLQATTGLMDATRRIARVAGPATVALFGRLLPMVQFFTLDALSFALSAASVAVLHRELPPRAPADAVPARRIWASIFDSIRLLRSHPLLSYAVFGCGITWSMWSLGLSLGVGMVLHQRFPNDAGSYGMVLAAYGFGNLLANLVVASLPIRRPARTMFLGLIIVGAGMTAMAWAPTVRGMMLAASLAAIGGPMDDLSLLTILQSSFRGGDIARLYRLLLAYASGCMLVTYLVSPWLFRVGSATQVLAASGLLILLTGLAGLTRFVLWPALRAGVRHGQNESDPLIPR